VIKAGRWAGALLEESFAQSMDVSALVDGHSVTLNCQDELVNRGTAV
jgi:hypothetical protein